MVTPLLHMMSTDLLRTHLLDDHCLLAIVPIPPDIVALDVGSGESSSDSSALAEACGPVVPLIVEFWKVLLFLSEKRVHFPGLLDFLKLHDGYRAVVHELYQGCS